MNQYHKIQTVYLRDPETKFKTLLEGEFSKPEFECLADSQWEVTEKVDGTNIRIMWDGEKVTIGGKTDRAQIPGPLLANLTERFVDKPEVFAEAFSGPVCLYGEGFGAKIQKVGGEYSPDQDFVLFDVLVGDYWLERRAVVGISEKLDTQIVPFLGFMTLTEAIELVRSGFDSKWGKFRAEGVIAKPKVQLFNRNGERIITKIKCKDFRA